MTSCVDTLYLSCLHHRPQDDFFVQMKKSQFLLSFHFLFTSSRVVFFFLCLVSFLLASQNFWLLSNLAHQSNKNTKIIPIQGIILPSGSTSTFNDQKVIKNDTVITLLLYITLDHTPFFCSFFTYLYPRTSFHVFLLWRKYEDVRQFCRYCSNKQRLRVGVISTRELHSPCL